MYIPKDFLQPSIASAVAFSKSYPFGNITTWGQDKLHSTHLPFVIDFEEATGKVAAYSHLAAANPHSPFLANQQSLIVFTGPHAYISPEHYERQSVPTWDYVAVHMHVRGELVADRETKLRLLEKIITTFEVEYLKRWEKLDEAYLSAMFQAIAMYSFKVEKIEMAEKLSQDRTFAEQQKVSDYLLQSANTNEFEIGKRIQQNLQQQSVGE